MGKPCAFQNKHERKPHNALCIARFLCVINIWFISFVNGFLCSLVGYFIFLVKINVTAGQSFLILIGLLDGLTPSTWWVVPFVPEGPRDVQASASPCCRLLRAALKTEAKFKKREWGNKTKTNQGKRYCDSEAKLVRGIRNLRQGEIFGVSCLTPSFFRLIKWRPNWDR